MLEAVWLLHHSQLRSSTVPPVQFRIRLKRHRDAQGNTAQLIAHQVTGHQSGSIDRQPRDRFGVEFYACADLTQPRGLHDRLLVAQKRGSGQFADSTDRTAKGLVACGDTQPRPETERNRLGAVLAAWEVPPILSSRMWV